MQKKKTASKTIKKSVLKSVKKKAVNKAKAKNGGGVVQAKEVLFSAPASTGRQVTVGQPYINGGQAVVVRHTEYLDDIYGMINFAINPAVQVYELNPGLLTSFPWLATVAAGFEQYRWRKLCFRYRSRIGTGVQGTVYYTTQLDSADPDFGSKSEMYAYVGTNSTNPWLDMNHNCLLKRGDYLKKYFVRTGDLSSGQDSQLYDTGKFTFVALGNTDNQFMGELLVDYEVELFNPKMNIASVGVASTLVADAASVIVPFGGGVSDQRWAPARDWTVTAQGLLTFLNKGLYLIQAFWKGDVLEFDTFLTGGSFAWAPDSSFEVDNGDVDTRCGVSFYGLASNAGDNCKFFLDLCENSSGYLNIVQAPLAMMDKLGTLLLDSSEGLQKLRRVHKDIKAEVKTHRQYRLEHGYLERKQRKLGEKPRQQQAERPLYQTPRPRLEGPALDVRHQSPSRAADSKRDG